MHIDRVREISLQYAKGIRPTKRKRKHREDLTARIEKIEAAIDWLVAASTCDIQGYPCPWNRRPQQDVLVRDAPSSMSASLNHHESTESSNLEVDRCPTPEPIRPARRTPRPVPTNLYNGDAPPWEGEYTLVLPKPYASK